MTHLNSAGVYGTNGFYRLVSLRTVPADVKAVDITWAVQKTRLVEFLVKPPKVQ